MDFKCLVDPLNLGSNPEKPLKNFKTSQCNYVSYWMNPKYNKCSVTKYISYHLLWADLIEGSFVTFPPHYDYRTKIQFGSRDTNVHAGEVIDPNAYGEIYGNVL